MLPLAALLALAVVLWAAVPSMRPSWLGDGPGAGIDRPGPAGSSAATATATPARSPAAAVLEELGSAERPTAAGVAAALDPLLADPALAGQISGLVVDAESDEILLDRDAGRTRIPASTTKILTAIAALEALGPDTRLRTSVVRTTDGIVLVGGGDPALSARVGVDERWTYAITPLDQLARSTAAALTTAGTTSVQLGYAADLFSGPGVSPSWPSSYVSGGEVAPVSALSLDGGRERPGLAARSGDPAAHAAAVFAQLLTSYGVAVSESPTEVATPAGELLAEARSPTVAVLVAQMLQRSDNDVAEMLARHVARAAGEPATFEGAGRALVATLDRVGVSTAGLVLEDGSGLSRDNRIAATTLVEALGAAYDDPDGRLGSALTDLPVAGFTGTLANRFDEPASAAQAGDIRAKTGYLSRVVTLSGYAVDETGRLLLFAFLADAVDPGAPPARAQEVLDELAARVAGCGCTVPPG